MMVFLELILWLARRLYRCLAETMIEHRLVSIIFLLAPIYIVPCGYGLRALLTWPVLQLTGLHVAAPFYLCLNLILRKRSILSVNFITFSKLSKPLKSAAIPILADVGTLSIGRTVYFLRNPTRPLPSHLGDMVCYAVSLVIADVFDLYLTDNSWAQPPVACPRRMSLDSLLQDYNDGGHYLILIFLCLICLRIAMQARDALRLGNYGQILDINHFRLASVAVEICERVFGIICWQLTAHASLHQHCWVFSSPSLGRVDHHGLGMAVVWFCVQYIRYCMDLSMELIMDYTPLHRLVNNLMEMLLLRHY